jgi:hypothetical protein
MGGQLSPNTNEMLQCTTGRYSDFGGSKFGQLNKALVASSVSEPGPEPQIKPFLENTSGDTV